MEARFKLGEVLAELGDLKGAKGPSKPPKAQATGGAIRATSRLEGAVQAPKAEEGLRGAGSAVEMLNRGKYSSALPVLGADVRKNPKMSQPMWRGSALLALKKLPEAMEAYGMALALRPDLSLHTSGSVRSTGCSETAPAVNHSQSYLSRRGKTATRYDQVANASPRLGLRQRVSLEGVR